MAPGRPVQGPGFLEDKFEPGAPVTGNDRFVLSLLPYEETTTYRKGTARAPEAVVDASGHVELFDETMHIDASTHGVLTLRPEISDLASITAHARAVRDEHPDALLGFVGGEHAITPAILGGVAREEMGIVWIDAHADLRESFYGRRDNHACAGFNSMPFGPIVQVGIRALAEEEHRLLSHTDRVRMFRHWCDEARDAILALPQDVYLSLDMDGFAPEVVRAVGTPEPGGLYWDDVMDVLGFLFEHRNVFAFDVVELCPVDTDVASEFIAARVIYKIMTFHALHRLGGTEG
jgi:agmatinase